MIIDSFMSPEPCPKCGSRVIVKKHLSFDEAYEDYECYCTNNNCDYKVWEEGADA